MKAIDLFALLSSAEKEELKKLLQVPDVQDTRSKCQKNGHTIKEVNIRQHWLTPPSGDLICTACGKTLKEIQKRERKRDRRNP